MARALLLVLDSFGIGESEDSAQFGDVGADTFGHIVEACYEGRADQAGLRNGPLHIPHLTELGLALAATASTGKRYPGLNYLQKPNGRYGYAKEVSKGKDTPSGHWEMTGVPVMFEWGYFLNPTDCFPATLLQDLIKLGNIPGVIGNKHASGTKIIAELGAEHLQTLKPIVYTSADSVFQIAAHEQAFGLQRLYDLCEIARKLVDPYNVGRVIARPFIGEPGKWVRTVNRKDYSTPPPAPTLLDHLYDAGREVIGIGKIADIFPHRSITQIIKGLDDRGLWQKTIDTLNSASPGSLIFTNLVDFDTAYGHRRDVAGYAAALEWFDSQIPTLIQALQPDDLLIITADHGCDPTYPGTDHTREHVPVLAYGKNLKPGFIGARESFADIAETIARYLGIPAMNRGVAFL